MVGNALQHEPGVVRVVTSPGWVAWPFDSGEALLVAWPVDEFELVLLDTDLPGMSGLEVCQHVRGPAGVIFIIEHTELRTRLQALTPEQTTASCGR